MAVRTVTVRLRADISNYTRGMRDAARSTSQIAGAGAAVSTALVAGFAVAAASAAKFDKAMSNVRAVTQASSGDMGKLRAAALEAAKTTKYSAGEAADAEAELARAGVDTADIIGGALKGALSLAASGQIDLSESATVAAQAMNTFGLAGRDVEHVADLLSAGANKSAADVHGLGMSLRMGGLLAHQTGLSIEDTVGVLAAFADHALIGSDAGTSLKVMLQRLVPQSKEAQAAMDAIGFSAYDSTGKFVGLTELSARMKTSFSKLTPEARNAAMATIFGADAVRSATILYELGADGIKEYVNAVNDQGAAARTAAVQTDNLIGDFDRLKSAIEVALIEGGSSANGMLRDMTQFVTRLVNAYNDLPPSVQHAVTLTSGFAGTAGLAGAALLLLLPRIAATRAALVSMGVTAARTRAAMMGLGRMSIVLVGMAAMTWSVDKLTAGLQKAPPSAAKLAEALVDLAQKGKVAGELSKTFGEDMDGLGEAVARIAHPGALDRVEDFFGTFDPGTEFGGPGLDRAKQKVTALDQALATLVQSGATREAATAFASFAKEANAGGTSTAKFRTLLPQYTEALAGAAVQQKTTADTQGELGDATQLTADQMADQRTEAEKLSDALKALNGFAISAAEGEIGFRDSMSKLSEVVKENGVSLDVTTKKGRETKTAFLDAAKAAMDHGQAVAEQSGSIDAGNAVLEQDIALLRASMGAAGLSKAAIDQLTKAYLRLPESASTTFTTPGAARAAAAIADLRQKLMAVPPGKTITVKAPTAAVVKALEAAGYSVKKIPGSKKVTITAPTGTAVANAMALKRALDAIQGKTVTVVTRHVKVETGEATRRELTPGKYARGGAIRTWPGGGPIYGPGTGTSDSIPALVSNGEYVIKADAVRKYGVAMFNRLNAMRYASGGSVGTYDPTELAVLGGAGAGLSRYNELVGQLREAWKEYKAAVAELNKVRKGKSTAAERREAAQRVTATRGTVFNLDAKLGLARGAQAPAVFNLNAYQKQLYNSLRATQIWRTNLARIATRGGQEVADLLEGMGEEGVALVNKLAGASAKQFTAIVAQLKATAGLAQATLADFTKQLTTSTNQSAQFAKDIQTLASRGFGDLAQALAAQGDSSAMALAHQAVGNSKSATAANAAVGKANAALTGDDLTSAVILLSTLRAAPNRGWEDLIAAGLSADVLRRIVPHMLGQIALLPALNKARFLAQWNSGGTVAMARGGILTRPSLVLGGEAGVPESWIPHDGSTRSRTLLSATAAAMGYQLVPAGRYGSSGSAVAAAAPSAIAVQVFVGDREIRDIVRVEATPIVRASEERAAYRARVGRH
ncbi:phage tail tape measure protein [Streptomyces sp. NPDC059828]|uniref:phage tail tape measure protein n=1 Tax=Streptomyces sp. NPDC059828 TaxID=3346965 RepID=UPI0036674D9E